MTIRHQQALHQIDVVARIGSIRKAAEQLNITSTALNRRILGMEEELGVALFDRHSGGVNLSTAGELFVHHARNQIADMERVRSQIADLAGERRGHVSIACGQAMLEGFMPKMIRAYRAEHPGVTFDVRVCHRRDYQRALNDFSADIALVFEPVIDHDFHFITEVPQRLQAVYTKKHALGKCEEIRLRDCLDYPLVLPTENNGVRYLLNSATVRLQRELNVVVESDNHTLLRQCLDNVNTLGFQIPIGLTGQSATNLLNVPVSDKDLPVGRLYLGQKKGRNLSVAAARFLEQMAEALEMYS